MIILFCSDGSKNFLSETLRLLNGFHNISWLKVDIEKKASAVLIKSEKRKKKKKKKKKEWRGTMQRIETLRFLCLNERNVNLIPIWAVI